MEKLGGHLLNVCTTWHSSSRPLRVLAILCTELLICGREISSIELTKANLLLLKFCKKVQHLYGNLAITPNMHLHGHIVECVKDYGPIYTFWLFSFERYNGILGNYPTNKRNTSEQLMRRFIREASSEMFQEHFVKTLPMARNTSVLHQHQLLNTMTMCSDLQFVSFPSISKFKALDSS